MTPICKNQIMIFGPKPPEGEALAITISPVPIATSHSCRDRHRLARVVRMLTARRTRFCRRMKRLRDPSWRDTPILKEADHAIWLDTGPESIAGSTRMKAGTAQRITLNVFSSVVMILLNGVVPLAATAMTTSSPPMSCG